MLKAIIKEPKQLADASVIWLHGLGANGHDFAEALPFLHLPQNHTIRFIFPHAPEQAVTLNGGMWMPAWYDIFGLGVDSKEDEPGLRRAKGLIETLISQQIEQGIPSHRIVLAGFSQGGALALYTGLRAQQPLAGIIGLSTYLPVAERLPEEAAAQNKGIPIWMAHGARDPIVSFTLGDLSRKHLEAAGYVVDWHTYPILHTVSEEELQAIGQWLYHRLYS